MDKTIEWKDDCSLMVDQTLIPFEYKKIKIKTSKEMYNAIKTMIVRGAPAIGIAGAHGMCLAAKELYEENNFIKKLLEKAQYLNSARPTAVNLSWAINEQKKVIENNKNETPKKILNALIENAIRLENEDILINKKIGDFGASVVPLGAGILTHCNAGALATVGYGTALGVIRSAYKKDSSISVFADETRPRQQGARITTFELVRDNIPVTLITDGMCSYFMKKGMINFVVTGADRIAANGDSANKIGTSTIAIAASYYNIPFYIAAPKSTIDMSIKSGNDIVIELRDENEVKIINGKSVCAEGTKVINPAFDITDSGLIKGIITEYGIFKPNELQKIFS
ncbi:MAG: S-methyl-5-thioribose-1-phosphate isomerase [Candidatus Gastranaerophilales bacterium]|nr:S-methyl-5-thioribose-1-phosphate isomerase [Candidatus Gastranaerophilales bacterium]